MRLKLLVRNIAHKVDLKVLEFLINYAAGDGV